MDFKKAQSPGQLGSASNEHSHSLRLAFMVAVSSSSSFFGVGRIESRPVLNMLRTDPCGDGGLGTGASGVSVSVSAVGTSSETIDELGEICAGPPNSCIHSSSGTESRPDTDSG